MFDDPYERDRSWVQPGTEVAIISSGGWHTATRTIEKVGKRDITLTDWPHAKFRVSDLSEQGTERYYGSQIVPVDSDRYRNILANKALREKKNAATAAVNAWDKAKESVANMDDAIARLTEYRAAYAADGDDAE